MNIVVANWKMNGDIFLAEQFVGRLNEIEDVCEIIICPPAALLWSFRNFKYYLGAQNCFYEESGAFTGENSPRLLKELGCDYVLLGHSERRALFHESDEVIYRKWNAAVAQSLRPIVCIGEKLDERSNWKEVLSRQLKNYIDRRDLNDTIFAYEPVWSIGTGLTPSEEHLAEVIIFLKGILPTSSLLYGGSVSSRNIGGIMSIDGVTGVLVGGSSLKIEEFENIIRQMSENSQI